MIHGIVQAVQLFLKSVPRGVSLTTTALAILLGFLVFYLGQGLDPTDALYLTIVTISTVGYGDVSPSGACTDDEGNDIGSSTTCVGMRVFTVFYILIGCSYVFGTLADVCGRALEKFSVFVKLQIDRLDLTQAAVDSTGDGVADTNVTGRSLGLSGSAHDITGDGNADFIEPPSALVFYAQELLPAVLLLTLVQLASAGIFTTVEDLDFGEALYHCMITTTTVGYGDVPISTREGRLFACFHIIVSVSWLAAIIGWVGRLASVREAQLERANLILNPPDRESIMALDKDKQGVDELEFVVGMLMNLGVELCGQPLKWDDVRPFKLQFRQFDVSKTGRLSADDLEKYSTKMEQAKARMQKAREVGASDPTFLEMFGLKRANGEHGSGHLSLSMQGQMALLEKQDDAAAKMQALFRGRNERKKSGSLRDQRAGEPPKSGKAATAVAPA